MSQATQDPSHCRLLNLPPEIRNRICGYVLVDEGIVTLKQREVGQAYATANRLAILQSCRQVLGEAEALFYLENHLGFESAAHFFDFMTIAAPERTSMMRTLTV
ncbi:hypothetical protein LTR85_005390 [Meristemomyces frigidus]|nr:hypothetical protein LTR85_005390 [Meristemomyces frigidus]